MVPSLTDEAATPPENDLALKVLHDAVEDEAQYGNHHNHGEHQVHLELEAERGDERAEALLGGDELRHQGADQRERERGLEAGEDRGQRGGPGELPENVHARGYQ